MDQLMSSIYISHIVARGVEDPLDMMVGMIAHGMTSSLDLLEELRIATYIVSHTEEGSPYPELIELVQYPRGDLGYRTIIKRKVDTLPRDRWYTPACSGDKHAVPHGYTAEKTLDHSRPYC
jgi:hypothetical protein